MTDAARRVQRTYLTLTLLTTLSASFIWGVNTLFLLDAGLDNTEAFLANAAFTLGMVIFEIPTGVVADTRGRRFSFLLGTATLLASTLAYFAMWQVRAPLWGWVVASMFIGLGFTFFSGATEAWLVDALGATGMTEGLDAVFGRAQAVSGGGMLAGSVLGGVLAQVTNLGAPYLARAGLLAVTLAVAAVAMRDLGFTPDAAARPLAAVRTVLAGSLEGGLRNPPVRWLMLAAVFTSGTGIYVFYALQPFLLELAGDPGAYSIAGLAAALIAAAQMVGGLLARPACRLVPSPDGRPRAGRGRQRGAGGGHRLRPLSGASAGARGRVGPGLGGDRPDSAGVRQRPDFVGPAGHGAVLRLAHGVRGRRGRAARSWPGRRRGRLSSVLPRVGSDRRGGDPLHPPGPAGARRVRSEDGHTAGRSQTVLSPGTRWPSPADHGSCIQRNQAELLS